MVQHYDNSLSYAILHRQNAWFNTMITQCLIQYCSKYMVQYYDNSMSDTILHLQSALCRIITYQDIRQHYDCPGSIYNHINGQIHDAAL